MVDIGHGVEQVEGHAQLGRGRDRAAGSVQSCGGEDRTSISLSASSELLDTRELCTGQKIPVSVCH